MNRAEILKKLGEVIVDSSATEIDWSGVTENTTLESFGFDSLAVLDLIFDLEDSFGTSIETEDMLAMKTTGDLVTYLEKRIS